MKWAPAGRSAGMTNVSDTALRLHGLIRMVFATEPAGVGAAALLSGARASITSSTPAAGTLPWLVTSSVTFVFLPGAADNEFRTTAADRSTNGGAIRTVLVEPA